MSKRKISFLLNFLIVIAELIAFGYTLSKSHSIAVEYYTNDSNIIALFSSILFIIFFRKKKEFIKDLRLLATTLLAVTFIVVVFILCPMYNFNYKLLMFTDTFFVFHTLVPIISIVSYVFFEEGSKKKYLGLIFTAVYACVLTILNLLNVVVGPYPFLEVRKQGVIMSFIWGMVILLGSYVVGVILYKLNKQKGKKGANIS